MLTPILIKGTQCQITDRNTYASHDIPTFLITTTDRVKCFGSLSVCRTCLFSRANNYDVNCGTTVYNEIKRNLPELLV